MLISAVDDPRDVISRMLTTEMLNRFNSDKSPPRILKLCVGDICYLIRTLGRKTKLATNKRVQIKVQTIENDDSPGEVHFIPRMIFRFTLPFDITYSHNNIIYDWLQIILTDWTIIIPGASCSAFALSNWPAIGFTRNGVKNQWLEEKYCHKPGRL